MSLHAGPTPGRPFGSSAPPSVCDVIGSAPPPAFKSRVSAEGVQSVDGSRSWSVVWGPPPVSVWHSSVCQVKRECCLLVCSFNRWSFRSVAFLCGLRSPL
ncbi:uncharacterized protein LOC112532707 [Gallus gallus]|uniref:uncharacterized protein LOC112532707 n=1 Tax=Gallus gallus TaxID=9031 RepID=UPI001AEA35D3|nr:uncharacterized protein LOC112532707 [Gallus gallus]